MKVRAVLLSLALLVLLPGVAFAQNSPPQTIPDEVLPTSIVPTSIVPTSIVPTSIVPTSIAPTSTTIGDVGVGVGNRPNPTQVGGVTLPRTGTELAVLLAVAVALLVLGGLLVANARRSKRTASA